jgi:hypothetical protein
MDSKLIVKKLLEDGVVTINQGDIAITKVITEVVGGIEHSRIKLEDGEVVIMFDTVNEVLDYFRLNHDTSVLSIDEKPYNCNDNCQQSNLSRNFVPGRQVESNYYFGGAVFDSFSEINVKGSIVDNSKLDRYKFLNEKYGIGNWGRMCDLLNLDSDIGVYLVKSKNCLSHSYTDETTILKNGVVWKPVTIDYAVDDGLNFC